MTNRTAWIAGLGQGLGSWGTLINGSDLASLANGSAVLSSVADIANGTNLDMFMDISFKFTGLTSATPAAGSNVSFFLATLNQDGSSYGSGELASGGTQTRAPAMPLLGSYGIETAVAATSFTGTVTGLTIPPQSFRVALFNNSSFAFSATAGNCVVTYKTYNLNLNSYTVDVFTAFKLKNPLTYPAGRLPGFDPTIIPNVICSTVITGTGLAIRLVPTFKSSGTTTKFDGILGPVETTTPQISYTDCVTAPANASVTFGYIGNLSDVTSGTPRLVDWGNTGGWRMAAIT